MDKWDETDYNFLDIKLKLGFLNTSYTSTFNNPLPFLYVKGPFSKGSG